MVSRKLDAAIAEALGYEVRLMGENSFYYNTNKDYWTHSGDRIWHKVSAYSTDGNAMLKLDKEMQKRGYSLIAGRINDKYTALYQTENNSKIVHSINTMPESVAIAAYNVLTGKEWTSIV